MLPWVAPALLAYGRLVGRPCSLLVSVDCSSVCVVSAGWLRLLAVEDYFPPYCLLAVRRIGALMMVGVAGC